MAGLMDKGGVGEAGLTLPRRLAAWSMQDSAITRQTLRFSVT